MGSCYKKYKSCDDKLDFIDDGSMSFVEKMCYIIQLLKETVTKVDGFEDEIDAKEDSINITSNRKLSELGNFTGSLDGQDVSLTITKIDSNTDQIDFLTNQFETGATGQVIDGGLFIDMDIDKNLDGGVF